MSEEVQPTPAPEEIVYEYLPVDDLGRALGAKQVFKGKDWQEVLTKVAESNKHLIKLNRDLNRKVRMGVAGDVDEIPANAPHFDIEAVSFSPRKLTEEEKIRISRDLLDPEKFDEASSLLLETQLGTKPENITRVLSQAQQDISAMRAKEESFAFMNATPEYYACKENYEAIVDWLIKYKLSPVFENFKLAYDRLKAVGLLLEAPIVREEVPTPPPVVVDEEPNLANTQPSIDEPSRITSESQPQSTRVNANIASGFTRTNTSNVGDQPVKSEKFSMAEIDRMSSELYKRKMVTDPEFKKFVDEFQAPRVVR